MRYGEEGGRLKDGGGATSVWWRMLCGIRSDGGLGKGSLFENNYLIEFRVFLNNLFDLW